MKIEKLIVFVFMFSLFSMAVFAVPGTWRGNVYIDGENASAGVTVTGYVEGVLKQTTLTGADEVPDYYYILNLVGASGEEVTFKIYGVDVLQSAQNWALGIHNLNLNITKLANGASCSYSAACTGGYCCSGATEYTDGSGTGTCQSSVCSAASTSTGGGGGGGTTPTTTTVISFTTAGVDVSLAKDNTAKFAFDGAYHTIKVIKIGADYVTLQIASTPVTIKLNLLESKKLDLNNDNYYDLYVKLNEIKDSKAYLTVKSINEIISPVIEKKPKEEQEEVLVKEEEDTKVSEIQDATSSEVAGQDITGRVVDIEDIPPAKPKTAIIIVLVIALLALISYLIYKKKKLY